MDFLNLINRLRQGQPGQGLQGSQAPGNRLYEDNTYSVPQVNPQPQMRNSDLLQGSYPADQLQFGNQYPGQGGGGFNQQSPKAKPMSHKQLLELISHLAGVYRSSRG